MLKHLAESERLHRSRPAVTVRLLRGGAIRTLVSKKGQPGRVGRKAAVAEALADIGLSPRSLVRDVAAWWLAASHFAPTAHGKKPR